MNGPARVVLVCLALGCAAKAEQQLVVNGVPVAGLDTSLVAGLSYAPAAAYARALGAEYRVDPAGGVVLMFGGRYASLEGFATAAEAAAAADALSVDGQVVASPGAVQTERGVYLPVKSVSAALGGQVAYLGALQTVAVVFPRPQLVHVVPPKAWGSFERFVLEFSAPVRFESDFVPTLLVARFRFFRAELADLALSESRFRGSRFSDAALVPGGGFIDFNLTLQAGNRYTVFADPASNGERVIIDILRDETTPSARDAARPVIGLEMPASPLRSALRRALRAAGLEVVVLPDSPAALPQSFALPLLLVVRTAPLEAQTLNLYYLEGDAPLLAAPPRSAAATDLSQTARERLDILATDLTVGRRLAEALATGLTDRTAYRVDSVMGAPLLALSGAAGRGVMLELPSAELTTPALAEPLAALLASQLSDTAQR